jgi:LmbE family N-acetylglucosaminyl deacetylase
VLKLRLTKPADTPYTILCLGAHCDDIEIGCGGTILKLLEQCENTDVHWIVFSSDATRAVEAQESAAVLLKQARSKTIVIKNFRNSFFPHTAADIKESFEDLKERISPDLVLTHCRGDLHQDHRVISDLTWNTFRDHLILEYEIPKYDADLGSPNLFVSLEERLAKKKITHIIDAFRSQKQKHWFDAETLSAMLRIRGVESCSRYAEGFYCRKMLVG